MSKSDFELKLLTKIANECNEYVWVKDTTNPKCVSYTTKKYSSLVSVIVKEPESYNGPEVEIKFKDYTDNVQSYSIKRNDENVEVMSTIYLVARKKSAEYAQKRLSELFGLESELKTEIELFDDVETTTLSTFNAVYTSYINPDR